MNNRSVQSLRQLEYNSDYDIWMELVGVERLLKLNQKQHSQRERTREGLWALVQPAPRVEAHVDFIDAFRSAKSAGRCNWLERVTELTAASQCLAELAQNHDEAVRCAVADNIHTPCDVKMRLAFDECINVRYVLAENANTPFAVLTVLVEDENPYVVHRAEQTLDRLSSRRVLRAVFHKPQRETKQA